MGAHPRLVHPHRLLGLHCCVRDNIQRAKLTFKESFQEFLQDGEEASAHPLALHPRIGDRKDIYVRHLRQPGHYGVDQGKF